MSMCVSSNIPLVERNCILVQNTDYVMIFERLMIESKRTFSHCIINVKNSCLCQSGDSVGGMHVTR